MNQKLKAQLDRSFELTHDLAVHLDEESLGLDLPKLPSNRIAGQLWCIVGARESYTRAIETGGWKGFSCSLTAPHVKQSVLAALEATHKRLDEIDFADLTDAEARRVIPGWNAWLRAAAVSARQSVERRNVAGGTAPAQVARQLRAAERFIKL